MKPKFLIIYPTYIKFEDLVNSFNSPPKQVVHPFYRPKLNRFEGKENRREKEHVCGNKKPPGCFNVTDRLYTYVVHH